MDRRNFLKGTFGGVCAAGVIVAASPTEVAAFAPQTAIPISLLSSKPEESQEEIDIGLIVYNHKGQPIGVIERFEYNTGFSWDSDFIHYVPGPTRMTIVAQGFANIKFNSESMSNISVRRLVRK